MTVSESTGLCSANTDQKGIYDLKGFTVQSLEDNAIALTYRGFVPIRLDAYIHTYTMLLNYINRFFIYLEMLLWVSQSARMPLRMLSTRKEKGTFT